MAAADLAALARHLRHHAVRADDEAGRNLFAAGERQGLPVSGDGDVRHLALQECDIVREQPAQPVHQRAVFDAVFGDRLDFGEAAAARDPDVLVVQGGGQYLVEHAGPAQRVAMRLFQFLAAEIRPAGIKGIDQRHRMPGAAQHDGCERARQSAAHDRDVGFVHDAPRNVRGR